MTDRVHSLQVVLDKDVRIDDVQALVSAIQQLRSVAAVTNLTADPSTHMAEVRARQLWRQKLIKLINEDQRET
jgi:hypothetical protein